MIWGIGFVALGTIILINILFDFNLPVIRTLIGLFLIYCGLKVIIPSSKNYHSSKPESTVAFNSAKFNTKSTTEDKAEYNIIFGEGTVNLTDLDYEKAPLTLEINTVFAQSKIIIPRSVSLETKINSVAASIELPEDTPAANNNKKIKLILNTVFGTTTVIRK